MARVLVRKPSFNKIVGAYRSQWKRFWMRLFTFGMYGRKGMGWWRDPKKAWYNWWYRRSSISVYQILGCKPSRGACFFAMLCAGIIGIVAAPFEATSAGIKAHKIKKERKKREAGEGTTRTTSSTGSQRSGSSNTTSRNTSTMSAPRTASYTSTPRTTTFSRSTVGTSKSTPTTTTRKTITERKTVSTVIPNPIKVDPLKEKPAPTYTYTPIYKPETTEVKPIITEQEQPKEPDENTPKSKPKHEKDQYIRKRMIIAGSSYCDQEVFAKLSIGTYFDLVAEPDNPYDKDAVMLTLDGKKIGYIAKADRLAFVTCLKLKRKIYGVITDIKSDEFPTRYEFETWFDGER